MMVVKGCESTPYHIHHMITYRTTFISLSIFPIRIVFLFFALLNSCVLFVAKCRNPNRLPHHTPLHPFYVWMPATYCFTV